MNNKIKILIAEHNANDLELIETELKISGIDYQSAIVQNEEGFRKAIKNFMPDFILSAYAFPSFDGPAAYKIKEELAAQTPFIFVSRTIAEEHCVELIKNGLTDYNLKDRLFSLTIKIKRALKELKEREQKDKIEAELIKSEARLIEAQAIAKVGSWETDLSTLEVIGSAETYRIFGIDPSDFHASRPGFLGLVHPGDRKEVDAAFLESLSNASINSIVHRIVTPGGLVKIVEEKWQIYCNEQGLPYRAVGACQDITERKKVEEQQEFERRDRDSLINGTEDLVWSVNSDLKLVAANDAFLQNMEALSGQKLKAGDAVLTKDIFPVDFLAFWEKSYKKALLGESFKEEIYAPAMNKRAAYWSEIRFKPIINRDRVIGTACYSRNITEKNQQRIR